MQELEELNPNADAVVNETVFGEFSYLYNEIITKHNDFFDFYTPEEFNEEDYVSWLNEKVNNALVNSFELLLINTKGK